MPTVIDLLNLGSAGVAINGAADYAQIGVSVSSAGDFNNDGIEDFIFSGPVTDLILGGRGVTYLIFGKIGGIGPINLSTLTPSQGFAIYGPNNFFGGDSGVDMISAAAGDVNGDGYDDIIIGAPRNRDWAGAAFVLYGHGGTSGSVDLGTLPVQQGVALLAPPHFGGTQYGAFLGVSVAGIGDINNDGYDDIAIGAENDSSVAVNGGRAYVLFGSAAGFANVNFTTLTAQQGFILNGTQASGFAGHDVTGLGDVNGDGIDDFAVSVPAHDSQKGAVYVYFGKSTGLVSTALGAIAAVDGFVITNTSGLNLAGWSISNAGDVNGDGFKDILIDAGRFGSTPGAYVLFGQAGGFGTVDLATLTASQGFMVAQGTATGPVYSLSAAGDVNADGFDDIIIGVSNPVTGVGINHVIYGSAGMDSATLGVSDGLTLQTGIVIDGISWAVGAADINGDGFSDLLSGARITNGLGFARGAVYAVYGVSPTTAVTRIGSIANQTIRGGTGDDALSGLGGNDMLYGNIGNDVLDGGTGVDRMFGGVGDDTYIVDNVGDIATEALNEGIDSIQSSISWTLDSNVENLILTGPSAQIGSGNDLANILTGNAAASTLIGGGGNDRLILGSGAAGSAINGGADIDTLVIGSNIASLAGLVGIEALELVGGASLTLTGTQFANGLAKNTAISGTGSITINMDTGVNFSAAGMSFTGTGVAVVVNGTSGIDIIKLGLGNSGNNTVNGGDGVDQIRGSQRVDTINGDGGNDKIMSLGGADVLTGGGGNDQFRYFSASDSGVGVANSDRITDFTIGGDRLNFALIDADAVAAGDQAFAFIGTGAFAATGLGQIRYTSSGADLLVQADVNGDGIADMEIILQGLNGQALISADFIL